MIARNWLESNLFYTSFNWQVKLDGFLALPDMLLLPQISLLLSTIHRNNVKHRAFEVICTIFKQLHAAVHDPANGYQSPNGLISRTPEQVQELLLGDRQ